MMAGMDDKDDTEDEITLESMSGLAKILAKLDENNVRQILINICLRIRPCFEKVSGKQTGITSAKHFFNNAAIVSLSGSTHDLIVFSCRPCFRRDTTCTVYKKSWTTSLSWLLLHQAKTTKDCISLPFRTVKECSLKDEESFQFS